MDIEYFVTRDQAKTLIELGFDFDCDYVWCGNFILHESQLTLESNKKISFPAPLICQAIKWLRERGYCIEPRFMRIDAYTYEIYGEKYKNDFTVYNTPEEALSASITRCLDILKE